jgi:adenine deaminase
MNPELIAVSRGDQPADVLLVGGRVVNVFTGEVESAPVALKGAWVAGVGEGYRARSVVELDGAFIAPGFIDAHVHIESSLATPPEFCRAVVPRGTTTVISDPHEIANVHGLEGIRYMLAASEGLPLTVFVQASSCVPATPMATAGASLGAEDLVSLLDHPRVLGLAEVMNFPGVIAADPGVWSKLDAFRGRPIDGHAPGVTGTQLNAYVAAGPSSDHESTTPHEALEKLRRGLFLFLREATNARNLSTLLPVLTDGNRRRVALCTDDRQPPDLLDEGGIDAMLRTVMASGVPPVEAIRLATLNPAEFFRLEDRGAVAPGRRADLVILDRLEGLEIREVWSAGSPVARAGHLLPGSLPGDSVDPPPPRVRTGTEAYDLSIPAADGEVRVIGVVPDQLVTRHLTMRPTIHDGQVVADPGRDLLKIVVVERHAGSGRRGLGLVQGMGLARGAIAGTVAHDHHNIIAVGADDDSLRTAIDELVRLGGGLVVAEGEAVSASLPLPIGGLMSAEPIETIRAALDSAVGKARDLGSDLHDPFMAMSFLGLEVIPSLKITDLGLVDVEAFRGVSIWVDEGVSA